MITIPQAVEDIISSTPYFEQGISKDLLNLSALARIIKPQIEKKLYKTKVSEAALIMALVRLKPKIKKKTAIPKLFKQMRDITVRSNLVEITFLNSSVTDHIHNSISKLIAQKKDIFFSVIQGVRESSIILNQNLEISLRKFLTSKPLSRVENLSAITISLPRDNRKTPGIYYTLLKALAWENINLVEVISNFNEVTLVFDNPDIDKAFSIIKSLTQKER